jgi:molecular chaperone GrpE
MDDLERMIANTPEDLQNNALFTWIQTLHKSLGKDLEKMGVKAFISKWEKVNPDKHDVMTQAYWEEGIIVDEFEKWYLLGEKVLRHARVVVGNGE